MKQLSEKMKEAYKLLPLFGIDKLKDFQKKSLLFVGGVVLCIRRKGKRRVLWRQDDWNR